MYCASGCLLILLSVVASYANPQFGFGYPPVYQPNYGYQEPAIHSFRIANPYPSFEKAPQNPEDRFFLGTATLTVGTTTVTSTVTTSTTCTTATGAISICSPSGRRRRGLNAKSRGLFYTEDEDHFDSIFVRTPWVEYFNQVYSLNHNILILNVCFRREQRPQVLVEEKRQEREAQVEMVPFVIEPGFSAPDGRKGRFLVSFGTSTVIVSTTSTYTAILKALCKSTTSFSTCSGSGK